MPLVVTLICGRARRSATGGRPGKMTLMTRRARDVLGAYPELAAVLAAAVIGLGVQRPLAWLGARQDISVLLCILVFATAVTIDPRALRCLAMSWPHIFAAVLTGVTVRPSL